MTPSAHSSRVAAPSRPEPARRRGRPAPARPPRRVSGPLRPAPAGVAPRLRGPRADAPAVALPGAGLRLPARLRTLPDHPLVDRLIGGRAWIPVLAVLLIGLVTMQVSLLRMNTGMGQAIERSAVLDRQNAALRAINGRLSSGERVRDIALKAGLVDPVAGSVRFLSPGREDAARAAAGLRAPGTGKPEPSASASSSSSTATSPPTTPATAAPTQSATSASPSATPSATTGTTPSATSTAPTATATSPTAPSTTSASASGSSSRSASAAGGATAPGQ